MIVARRQIPLVLSEIGCPPMPNKDPGNFGPKTLQILPTVVVHWFVSFLIVLIAFDIDISFVLSTHLSFNHFNDLGRVYPSWTFSRKCCIRRGECGMDSLQVDIRRSCCPTTPRVPDTSTLHWYLLKSATTKGLQIIRAFLRVNDRHWRQCCGLQEV